MPTRREFLQTSLAASAAGILPLRGFAFAENEASAAPKQPNFVFILADDMGFSDVGCYGSEIETPHIDALARGGLRFSDFHNSPRCCPSRAALLTGLYSHQAGMGMMTSDAGRYPYPAYCGDLSEGCVTIAEALRAGGYTTLMTGKWHLTPLSAGKHNYPLQRGFDRYYGIINGAASYFDPASLTDGNDAIEVARADEDYYLTDAIGDRAARMIEDTAKEQKPFFLYAAFTAGHWPLMAPEKEIAKYKGRYSKGWDALRAERDRRQLAMGLVRPEWGLTARDPRVPAWDLASFHAWEERRMEVYAAQIDSLDQNVGKIVSALSRAGALENTIICFMSDNGGNFEEMGRVREGAQRPAFMPYRTRYGEPVVPGNDPAIMPGPATTYASYGIPWGNVSNTPFRLYKHYAHEGGIATPFIVHWPRGLRNRGIAHAIGHEIDVMPTFLEAAGVRYPARSKNGSAPPPLEGRSLLPVFAGGQIAERSLFWEHEGNSAVREEVEAGFAVPGCVGAYDMENDRTERHDLVDQQPDRVRKMAGDYAAWAQRVGVQPWPMPETPPGNEREGAMTAPAYLLKDRI